MIQSFSKLSHEEFQLLFICPALLAPLLFGQRECPLTHPLDFQALTLDHDTTIAITKPFQIQTFLPCEWRRFPCNQSFVQFMIGDVKVLDHLVGGDVTDVAGLAWADASVVRWLVACVPKQ